VSRFQDAPRVPKRRTHCAMKGCKNRLTPRATGRPRKFCGDRCRKRAQRLAHKTKSRVQKDEWTTPSRLFEELDAEFGPFTIDVAATAENAKCPRRFTKECDGLEQDWSDEVVFCNPPYSQARKWIEKAYSETRDGRCVVVMVLRASPGTKAWQEWVLPHAEVRYVPGRLRFGDAANVAPFDSAVVVFK
jgi:phage N-6-adenine-methyltransferase